MGNIKINMDSLSPKSFKKTVRHKVHQGDNIFRLLPPFGAEANGYPYQKWNVIWGLVDPNSGRMRPFASPSTYEGQCPVYDYLDLLKKKVDNLKKSNTPDEKIAELEKFISQIRPKSVYAYNASDKSGVVGVLELKSTAHKKVISLMNKYITDYNQDPTSLNSEPSDSGVWFNIKRNGEGFNTSYDAEKNQITVKDENGVPSFRDDRSSLAENIVHNFDDVAYDLGNIYQKLSYDELKDVLIANILSKLEEMPELNVPGFGLEDMGASADQIEAPAEQPATVQTAGYVAQVPVEPSQPAPAPTQTSSAGKDTEDLLAMADDIFNS